MAKKAVSYVKGTNGTKPTPQQIPNKPLPPYINTVDVTPFKPGKSK